MSNYTFNNGQAVKVTADHNHIIADNTTYHVGSSNRVQGAISVQIMQNGKCVGAIPQDKLLAVK